MKNDTMIDIHISCPTRGLPMQDMLVDDNEIKAMRDVLYQQGNSRQQLDVLCFERIQVTLGIMRQQFKQQGRKSKCYVEYAKQVRDEQRQLHEKLKAMAPRTYSNLEMILQHDAKIDGMNRCTAIELFVLHEYDIDELLSLIGECQDERFSCLPRTVLGFLTLGCRHDEDGCWLYYDEPELTEVEDYLNTWFDPQRTPFCVKM